MGSLALEVILAVLRLACRDDPPDRLGKPRPWGLLVFLIPVIVTLIAVFGPKMD
jgi:hypothetical protein